MKISSGFSFIEVMAALGVIAVAAVAVLTLINDTTDEQISIKNVDSAYMLAQQVLFELKRSNDIVSFGGQSGEFEDYPMYEWKTSVEELSNISVGVVAIRVYHVETDDEAILNYVIVRQ